MLPSSYILNKATTEYRASARFTFSNLGLPMLAKLEKSEAMLDR
jgi:hypothetical protein